MPHVLNFDNEYINQFIIFKFPIVLASLKNMGNSVTGLFDRKKKQAGEIAAEKAETTKKFAEEQVQKTQDAVKGATAGATNLVGGLADNVKGTADKAKDDGQKGIEKAGEIISDWLFMTIANE